MLPLGGENGTELAAALLRPRRLPHGYQQGWGGTRTLASPLPLPSGTALPCPAATPLLPPHPPPSHPSVFGNGTCPKSGSPEAGGAPQSPFPFSFMWRVGMFGGGQESVFLMSCASTPRQQGPPRLTPPPPRAAALPEEPSKRTSPASPGSCSTTRGPSGSSAEFLLGERRARALCWASTPTGALCLRTGPGGLPGLPVPSDRAPGAVCKARGVRTPLVLPQPAQSSGGIKSREGA